MRKENRYVAGCAIAEGGIALRLFEACHGAGLGARIDLGALTRVGEREHSVSRHGDNLLFGEFVGSVLLEVPFDSVLEGFLRDIPYYVIGEVTVEPEIQVVDQGRRVWQGSLASLAESWSKTFREVIE